MSFMSYFSKREAKKPRTLPAIPSMPLLRPFEIKDGVTIASIHVRGSLSTERYNSLLSTALEVY